MKKILCVLLFCVLLLTGCGVEPVNIVNDAAPDEPIRIVSVVESILPATPTPEPTATPLITPVPTDTPTPTPTLAPTPTPLPTDTPAPTAIPTATPDVSKAAQLVMVAAQYVNYPYTRGGKSPETGFDPSGFVYWCLKQMNENVKRRDSAGYAEEEGWMKITRMAELDAGDLLFFRTGDNENINCVCIYMGDNRMVYPSTSKGVVIVTEINSYWTNAFQWARRVF